MPTPSSQPRAALDYGDQLDLFSESDRGTQPSAARGISPAAARAAISPGWWQIVAYLFRRNSGVVVTECREVAGSLELATIRGSGPDAEVSTDRWACEVARSTCGCCGAGGAQLYCDFGQPVRVVCPRCRQQLLAGETFLAIADRHFTLEGTQRIPPLPVPSVVTARNGAPLTYSRLRQCTTLPPEELRELVRSIRTSMQATVCGEEDALIALSVLGALHVGGGLPRGARALVMGPSGSGKSTSVHALRAALAEWDIAWAFTAATDLSTVGWRGMSLNDLLGEALHGVAPDSLRARRAVVCVDELHHVGSVPGLDGVAKNKRDELIAAMLSLFGDGTIHLSDGTTEWATREALVIGIGIFPRALAAGRTPTSADLRLDGMSLELSSRIEHVIRLERLPEQQLVQLLHRWSALRDLADVCARLGYTVRISDEAVRHAARIVTLAGDEMTARTAGGWLVAALRRALTDALADPDRREIVITPDSLPVPPHATLERPDDPWKDRGWGDTPASP